MPKLIINEKQSWCSGYLVINRRGNFGNSNTFKTIFYEIYHMSKSEWFSMGEGNILINSYKYSK